MRSLLATTLVALALAAAIQRRELFGLRWAPTRHTCAAICAAALPALFSTLALLFPMGSMPFDVLLRVFIFGLCGFAIPWGYVLLVERGGLSSLGIGRHHWAASLVISLFFAGGSVFGLLRQVDITR